MAFMKIDVNKMRHNSPDPMLWLNTTGILCAELQQPVHSEKQFVGFSDPSCHYTQKKSGPLHFSMG